MCMKYFSLYGNVLPVHLQKPQKKSLKTKVRKMLQYLGNRNTCLVSLEGQGKSLASYTWFHCVQPQWEKRKWQLFFNRSFHLG